MSLCNTSVYQKISGSGKFYASQTGVSSFFVENSLSYSLKKTCYGTLRCFKIFRASQNFMHKKGISLNFIEKSFSQSADKLHRRTLLGFERILVSESFKQKRGEASRFFRKLFSLTAPKKLRQGTILCFRKFLVGKNILWIKGRYNNFRSKFLSHCTEIFLWKTLCGSKKIFFRKFSCIGEERGIMVLSRFFVSQHRNQKFCKRTLLFSGSFLVSKKDYG